MTIKEFIEVLKKLPQDYEIKLLAPETMCFCDFFTSDIHLEFNIDTEKPFIGLGFLD